MPGVSFDGNAPALSERDVALRDRLRDHVYLLANDIGERNETNAGSLVRARDYIAGQLREAGYDPELQPFSHGGETFYNVEAILPSAPPLPSEVSLVVGAHYDSIAGSPGANDNASGVATLLELARSLRGQSFPISVRFVAFANEEPPYFNTGRGMGSVEYVRQLQNPAERIRGMLSLETVGVYSDRPGSQAYPPLVGAFYPDKGDFVAWVGNVGSRSLVRQAIEAFRSVATLPSQGAALPPAVPGVALSDHRSFWEVGVPALMVTDTAPFRDPHYHLQTDTPERLDYDRMARLVRGLEVVVESLAKQ